MHRSPDADKTDARKASRFQGRNFPLADVAGNVVTTMLARAVIP